MGHDRSRSASRVLVPFMLALLLAPYGLGCDGGGVHPTHRDGGGDASASPDADGDAISDAAEGRSARTDTDGDGTPDYLDTDSDGDGIDDTIEAGDGDVTTPPLDSDSDGLPDFQDVDADGNGIPDASEVAGDVDGDHTPNYEDRDDDGDFTPDIDEVGDPTSPVDTDGDGMPDYQDTDSDGDTIGDVHEHGPDTDRDATPDIRDLDSDGDGIPDAMEAGDVDLTTPPVDTDHDTIPDFRDPDSDGDGISDRDEVTGHTSPTNADSDGDGISDLIEIAAGSDPNDGTDSPRTRGDFVFVVPFEMDPSPPRDTLEFRTNIQFADIYFLFDITTSMDGEIAALAISTFGGTEDLYRALWALADPAAAPGETGCTGPSATTIGCPAFRPEAVRIAVVFTDEDSDGAETVAQAGDALAAAGITTIGVWSGGASAQRQELVDVVQRSGSLSGAGTPLVFDGVDATVVPAVVSAIDEVVRGVPLRVTIEATDEPGDAGDALQFVDYLEVNGSGGPCTAVTPLEDTDGDGRNDAFPALLPGTPVCWDVVPARNTTVMPDLVPLVFRARLTVHGDGSPLDSRLVYFLVPPRIPTPGGPD